MTDLSKLQELATLVEVLDAAVRGQRTATSPADGRVAPSSLGGAASWGGSGHSGRTRRTKGRSTARRELVVAEVVEW